jgi:hypothetical protein
MFYFVDLSALAILIFWISSLHNLSKSFLIKLETDKPLFSEKSKYGTSSAHDGSIVLETNRCHNLYLPSSSSPNSSFNFLLKAAITSITAILPKGGDSFLKESPALLKYSLSSPSLSLSDFSPPSKLSGISTPSR